jgi:hypothetical protein
MVVVPSGSLAKFADRIAFAVPVATDLRSVGYELHGLAAAAR